MVDIKDDYWLPQWALDTRICSKCGAKYLKIKASCPKCKVKNVPPRGKTHTYITIWEEE